MKIISGLYEHMVMQRNRRNFCEQNISGSAVPNSTVTGTDKRGKTIFSVKADTNGRFSAKITSWASGGPYSLNICDGTDSLAFNDLWVGDLWVLAGQSNMQGCAKLTISPAPIRAVRAFYMDDRWDIAKEPIHNYREANAEIHWVINGGHDAFDNAGPQVTGVGPGVFFAREMWQRTHIPQGLIASAHGGTAVELWDPELRDKGENSLYGAMYDRVVRNGGKVAGVLWYQGCTDTETPERTELFEFRTLALFRAMRKDFQNPRMPIIMAQLGRNMSASNHLRENRWSKIRDIQRNMHKKLPGMLTVPAIDLENDDTIHLSGNGHRILGSRMADAAELLMGNKNIMPPIELDKFSSTLSEKYQQWQITISFKNVVGKLHCDGQLPLGISLHHFGADNQIAVPPFCCRLEGKKIVIYTGAELGEKIAYAFGCNPAVNIHDEAGRSLPAFGPLYFRPTPQTSPMLGRVEVSSPVKGDDSYDALYPDAEKLSKLSFSAYQADSTYIAPTRLLCEGPYVYFFRWRVRCSKKCTPTALIGADGPFRLFCDGKEVAGYADVANPIIQDEFSVPLSLDEGEHEFIMGFAGKCGNAWGFCLRYINPEQILTLENESLPAEYIPELL